MQLKEVINQFINWKLPQTSKACKYNAYNCKWQLVNFAIALHFAGIDSIDKVREKEITKYLNISEYFNHSSSTRQKQAIAIRKMLEYCQFRNIKCENPKLVPLIKSEKVLPRVANENDYYKLLNTLPITGYNNIRNRAILACLHDAGCRLGELLSLNCSDLDMSGKQAVIRTEKANSFRNIFFRQETTIYLKTWLHKREEILEHLTLEDKDALFISIVGGCMGEQNLAHRCDLEGIGQMLRTWSKKAGLKQNFNAHSLRHRYGRVLAENGMDEVLIPQFMGHKSIASSRVYVQLFGPKLKEMYHKVFGE